MRDLWKSLAMLAAVCLVVLLPAPASASVIESAPVAGVIRPADGPIDYTPSPNKWRKWMINQLSSVLGKATPDKWRAEQIANSMLYEHSWEQWEAQLGIDGMRYNDTGQMVGIKYTNRGQGTYQDVVINGLEQKAKEKNAMLIKSGIRTVVPATQATALKVLRGAGGALAVVTAYDLSVSLTSAAFDGVSGWFGWDSLGEVCQMTRDATIGSWALRTISGRDCSGWDQAHTYEPNSDAPKTFDDPNIAGLVLGKFLGSATVSGSVSACYDKPSTVPSGYAARIRLSDGTYAFIGTWTPAGSNVNCTQIGKSGTGYSAWPTSKGGSWMPIEVTGPSGYKWTQTATAGDPDRTLKCTVKMTDGTSVSGVGQTYKESSGTVGGPPCPAVPPGKTPSSVDVTQSTPGQPDAPMYSQPVSPEAQQMFTQYQECMAGACALDLVQKSDGKSCFDIDQGCPGWWAAAGHSTDTLQCRYGMHNVPIQECAVYAGLFEPGRTAVDAPWSDPSTGTWSGGKNTPAQGEKAMQTPLQNPELVRSCDLSDIGFDPIGWVVRPVQCAMAWAFVPRPTVVDASFAGANQGWEHKPPAVIANAVSSMVVAPSASGCSKSVTYAGVTFNVVDACSGPMATIAQYSRWITSAGFVVLAIVMLRRRVAAAAGYNVGQG